MKKPEVEKYPVCLYRGAPRDTLDAIAAGLVFPVRAALPRDITPTRRVREAVRRFVDEKA